MKDQCNSCMAFKLQNLTEEEHFDLEYFVVTTHDLDSTLLRRKISVVSPLQIEYIKTS